MTDLSVTTTDIPGLLVIDLPVLGDNRGWFKENWQREKMVALGLPDFHPVQNNVSFNGSTGTTRGIHAEPWDKLVSVATGAVFGAWVDLRVGDSFGTVFVTELGPGRAVFVPRGVGNSYQTLVDDTAYTYLTNDHWNTSASYTQLNLADETVAVPWPISLDAAEVSDKDKAHPRLGDVVPMPPRRTLVLGAGGQLGRALVQTIPDADGWGRDDFDVTDASSYDGVSWRDYDVIINAAAYTKVDAAETPEGRRDAWRVNVMAVVELAKVATRHDLTLVHVSSDYVFDGEVERHTTDEGFSPLGVYGQTKAAADAVVMTVPRHYIVRTSWVVGEGHNFVSTMKRLADSGVDPEVVSDQLGRLTTTTDLADGIVRLLADGAPHGTHHVTGSGPVKSWFDIAQDVFAAGGHDPARVTAVSTEDFAAGKSVAPRPRHSTLQLPDEA